MVSGHAFTREHPFMISTKHLRFEAGFHLLKGTPMEWKTPNFEEIPLACEINSYAKATL